MPLQDFSALELSQPPRHIGRIRLNEIVGDWSENQALNPRLLAAEVADAIRSTSPPNTPVAQGYAVVVGLVDNGPPAGIVTIGALTEYFDGVSTGCAPDSMMTASGSIRAGGVLLARSWIDRLVTEATERAAIASGLAQVMEAAPVQFGSSAAPAYIQPPPPSGSDPECLAIRQAQQRKEGEQSAAEKLDAFQIEAQLLKAENAMLTGRLALSEADLATEREARGAERAARLAAEERRDEAEADRDAMSDKFPELGRKLVEVAALFGKKSAQQRHQSSKVLLLTVAGLLELLLDRKRPNYDQGAASKAIALRGWRSAGERQVNEVFAEAKKIAKEARKEATSKATDIQDSNAAPSD